MPRSPALSTPWTDHDDLCDLGVNNDWKTVSAVLDAWEKTPPPDDHIVEQLTGCDRDTTCWSVLHHAAADNHGPLVARLLKLGADPYYFKGRGRELRYSPLGVAAYWASPDALRAFMQHGCEVYLRSPNLAEDEPGSTLLHRLMRMDPKGNVTPSSQHEVIRLLVNAYDDPMRRDEKGQTPLDLASTPEKARFFLEVYERRVLTEELDRQRLLESLEPIEPPRVGRRRL